MWKGCRHGVPDATKEGKILLNSADDGMADFMSTILLLAAMAMRWYLC